MPFEDINNKENAFVQDDSIYNKQTKAVPKPESNIGVDTDNTVLNKIADIIYEQKDKDAFITEMDKLIESKTSESRKQKITEYKSYILKHWKGILNMKDSLCKSSMEAHIEHCIASQFSSVPKAYSENHIESYLKLQEMQLNNISIFNYYLSTYNSEDDFVYNMQKEVDFSIFENSTSNVPILNSSSHLSAVIMGIRNTYATFR